MVMLNFSDKPQYPEIQKSIMLVRLESIEEKQGRNGQYLMWKFRVIQEPHIDRFAWASSPTAWFPDSKLDGFIKAFNLPTTNLETAQLIGRYVKAGVKSNLTPKGDFPRVEDLYCLSPMDTTIIEAYERQVASKPTSATNAGFRQASRPSTTPTSSVPAWTPQSNAFPPAWNPPVQAPTNPVNQAQPQAPQWNSAPPVVSPNPWPSPAVNPSTFQAPVRAPGRNDDIPF